MQAFNNDKTKKDTALYQRELRAKNPEKFREYSRKWRANNLEKAQMLAKKYYAQNPDKPKEYAKKWRKENPEKLADIIMKNKYGISVNQVQELLLKQKGNCALCNLPPTKQNLFVDHNHKTGKVRGLLHNRCNVLVGYVEKSPVTIKLVLKYIKKHE